MKKNFNEPMLEIAELSVVDVIAASNEDYNPGQGGTPGMGM